MRLPFIGQAYENRSIPISSQRSINWYPEIDDDPLKQSRSPVSLQAVSGTDLFVDLGGNQIRGLYYSEGLRRVYAVSDNDVFEVQENGITKNLGTVDGPGLVSITDNGTQVAFATGDSYFVFDAADGLAIVEGVSAKKLAFQDGFIILASTDGTTWGISGLNDARSINPLDFTKANANPDPIIGLNQVERRIVVFGSDSVEIYWNSGAAAFPFQIVEGGSSNGFGLAGTFASVVQSSRVYWCSNDGHIYRNEGYTPTPISHKGIENALRTYTRLDDCEATEWTENGHFFVAFSFPSGGTTWVYDTTTGMWHQRSSGTKEKIWNGRFVIKAWDTKEVVCDRSDGRLGLLNLDTFTEFGDEMKARRTAPVTHSDRNEIFHNRLEIVMETGRTTTTTEPQARLKWSDDAGVTFSNNVNRGLGEVGEYNTKLTWFRLGQSKNRVYDLQITDVVRRNLISVHIESEVGAL